MVPGVEVPQAACAWWEAGYQHRATKPSPGGGGTKQDLQWAEGLPRSGPRAACGCCHCDLAWAKPPCLAADPRHPRGRAAPGLPGDTGETNTSCRTNNLTCWRRAEPGSIPGSACPVLPVASACSGLGWRELQGGRGARPPHWQSPRSRSCDPPWLLLGQQLLCLPAAPGQRGRAGQALALFLPHAQLVATQVVVEGLHVGEDALGVWLLPHDHHIFHLHQGHAIHQRPVETQPSARTLAGDLWHPGPAGAGHRCPQSRSAPAGTLCQPAALCPSSRGSQSSPAPPGKPCLCCTHAPNPAGWSGGRWGVLPSTAAASPGSALLSPLPVWSPPACWSGAQCLPTTGVIMPGFHQLSASLCLPLAAANLGVALTASVAPPTPTASGPLQWGKSPALTLPTSLHSSPPPGCRSPPSPHAGAPGGSA